MGYILKKLIDFSAMRTGISLRKSLLRGDFPLDHAACGTDASDSAHRSGGEIGRRARLRILKKGLSGRFKSFQQKPQNPHQIRLREVFSSFIKMQSSGAENPSLLHKLLHIFFNRKLHFSISQTKIKKCRHACHGL
jgi:hypothetical protein